jgi:hypothetical protein
LFDAIRFAIVTAVVVTIGAVGLAEDNKAKGEAGVNHFEKAAQDEAKGESKLGGEKEEKKPEGTRLLGSPTRLPVSKPAPRFG